MTLDEARKVQKRIEEFCKGFGLWLTVIEQRQPEPDVKWIRMEVSVRVDK